MYERDVFVLRKIRTKKNIANKLQKVNYLTELLFKLIDFFLFNFLTNTLLYLVCW